MDNIINLLKIGEDENINRLLRMCGGEYQHMEIEEICKHLYTYKGIGKIKEICKNDSKKTKQHIIEKIRQIQNSKCVQKYQMRGYYDALLVYNWCIQDNRNAEIINDPTLTRKKLTYINGGNSKCCDGCDRLPRFYTKLVPVIYVRT